MKFVRKIMIQGEEVKVYYIFKPDWFNIGFWTIVISGGLIFWFMVISPIVSFLR